MSYTLVLSCFKLKLYKNRIWLALHNETFPLNQLLVLFKWSNNTLLDVCNKTKYQW